MALVEAGIVGNLEAVGGPFGQRARCKIEFEHGGMFEIAGVERRIAIERKAQRETAGAGDLFHRAAVGRDTQDVAVLIAAPD